MAYPTPCGPPTDHREWLADGWNPGQMSSYMKPETRPYHGNVPYQICILRDPLGYGRTASQRPNRRGNMDYHNGDHYDHLSSRPLPPFHPSVFSPPRNLQQNQYYSSTEFGSYDIGLSRGIGPSYRQHMPNNIAARSVFRPPASHHPVGNIYQAFDEGSRYPAPKFLIEDQRQQAKTNQRTSNWILGLDPPNPPNFHIPPVLTKTCSSSLDDMTIPRSHGFDALHHQQNTLQAQEALDENGYSTERDELETLIEEDEDETSQHLPEEQDQVPVAIEVTNSPQRSQQTQQSQPPSNVPPLRTSVRSNLTFQNTQGKVRSQKFAKFDHVGILRDTEVPFVTRENQQSDSFGRNATGTLEQNLSIDAVNSGGYPIPSTESQYQEIISSMSSDSHKYPPHLSATPTSSNTLYGARDGSEDPVDLWRTACVNFNHGNWNAAIQNFQRIITICAVVSTKNPQPKIPLAYIHYNIGVLQSKVQHFEFAVVSFETAVAINPTLCAAWYCLGVVLERTGNAPKAVDALDAALKHFVGGNVMDFSQFGLGIFLYRTVIECDRHLCTGPFLHRYSQVRMFKTDAIFEHIEPPREAFEWEESEEDEEEGGRRARLWKSVKRVFKKKD